MGGGVPAGPGPAVTRSSGQQEAGGKRCAPHPASTGDPIVPPSWAAGVPLRVKFTHCVLRAHRGAGEADPGGFGTVSGCAALLLAPSTGAHGPSPCGPDLPGLAGGQHLLGTCPRRPFAARRPLAGLAGLRAPRFRPGASCIPWNRLSDQSHHLLCTHSSLLPSGFCVSLLSCLHGLEASFRLFCLHRGLIRFCVTRLPGPLLRPSLCCFRRNVPLLTPSCHLVVPDLQRLPPARGGLGVKCHTLG